jgi:hypothetical protein
MVAANPNGHLPSTASQTLALHKRLGERLRRYFDKHPEVSHEEFVIEALRKELLDREQAELRLDGRSVRGRFSAHPALSAEDIAIHVRLNQRLAKLHHARDGLLRRFGRFLRSTRLGRWLTSRR